MHRGDGHGAGSRVSAMMGFAALYPSYERFFRPTNLRIQLQQAHFFDRYGIGQNPCKSPQKNALRRRSRTNLTAPPSPMV